MSLRASGLKHCLPIAEEAPRERSQWLQRKNNDWNFLLRPHRTSPYANGWQGAHHVSNGDNGSPYSMISPRARTETRRPPHIPRKFPISPCHSSSIALFPCKYCIYTHRGTERLLQYSPLKEARGIYISLPVAEGAECTCLYEEQSQTH
mgnify:CR=1 FL=1